MMIVTAGLFLLMGALAGCGESAAPVQQVPRVKVTSFSPVGTGEDRAAVQPSAIRIRFDRPVVAEEAVGKAVAAPPVKIVPSLRGMVAFSGRTDAAISVRVGGLWCATPPRSPPGLGAHVPSAAVTCSF